MWSRVKGREGNSWRVVFFFFSSPTLLCSAKSHMLCSSASDKSVAPNLTRFSGSGSGSEAASLPAPNQIRLSTLFWDFFFSLPIFWPPLIPLVKVIQCGAVSSTLIARAVAIIAQLRFIFTLFFFSFKDQHHAACFLLTRKMLVPVGVQGKC